MGVERGSDYMLNDDLVVVGSKPGQPAGKARHEEVGCRPVWKEEGCPGSGVTVVFLAMGKK